MVSIVAVGLLSSVSALAQTKTVKVKFKPGATGGTYKNSVTGYGTVDFVVTANAGQTMSAKLTSSNQSLYFYVRKSGANEAISERARDAIDWSGQLPDTGEYVVRVYLYRNAARQAKAVPFTLRIEIK